MQKLRYLKLFLTGVSGFVIFLGLAPAGASSANISHAYHASGTIANGSIVSLDQERSDYVQLANVNNGALIDGVVIASNDSLLAVDPSNTTIQVATSGTVNTLVSTLNGDISVGDRISVSPFNGVGMKSLPGSHVIGLSETAFNSSVSGASKQVVHDKYGKASDIWLGYVQVSIAIGTDNSTSNTQQLNSLQKLAKNLTGRTVSTIRVATSMAIAIATVLVLAILVYASIYGSIMSVGRNPLAKYTIFRTLGSVLGMALLVASVASITIFYLLR